jgi:glycerol-3-phosphate dehydrogenase
MKRDLTALTKNVYDLVVVGGGIYGACVAWEAVLRGLSAALVEQKDFGAATSANSLKIIHGGLRYLQHADFKRMRESIRERQALMRIAPHLVHPLPVLIPTYGHGIRGKEVFSLMLMVNDLIGCDRNRLADPQKHIPRGRLISKEECLRLLPGVQQEGLTGGAIFYDAQVYNSERLILSFLRSAANAGADLANYVAVSGFLKDGDGVAGVEVKDLLSGERFDIRARMVVNTCGPWVDRVLGLLSGHNLQLGVRFAKAINLVTRPLFDTYATGISSQNGYRDSDALLNKGSRLLFITPWRGHSLIGTAYAVYGDDPDALNVTEQDIQRFVHEINQACPSANLRGEETSFVHGGLVPISGICPETGDVQLAKHHAIHDHRQDGLKGLISVVGVKYTTARHVAEKVVDRIFAVWGQKPRRSASSITPLHGGQIAQFEAFRHAAMGERPYGFGEEAVTSLIYNYGSAYPEVLRYLDMPVDSSHTPPDRLALLKAEVLHGVREEMAQKLGDVIFRRTELGTAGHPGDEVLRACAGIMSAELRWSPCRTQQELQEVQSLFRVGQGCAR